MNERIVKNAVTNFSKDININSEIIQEASERFLWKSIKEVRKEDPFIYDEMRCLSTMNQTNLLEQRLMMEFIDLEEVTECVIDAFIKALEKSYEVNEFVGENYSEEYGQMILEDFVVFLSEDDNFTQKMKILAKEGSSKILKKAKGFGKFIINTLPTLFPPSAAITAMHLGVSFSFSMLILVALMIMVSVVMYSTGNSIQRQQIEVIKKVADVIHSISKFVKNGTEKYKVLYQLTFANEEKCYKKLGIDPKKIGFRGMIGMKDDPNSLLQKILFVNGSTPKFDLLRACYLENFLDRISIFFDLYFDCLKKTGDWNEVRNMSDDKFITMFRVKGGLYPACDQFRDQAVKAIRTFEDLVEYLYEKNPSKKSQWLMLLNRYILDKKNLQDKLKKDFRKKISDNSTFRGEKYKKMGQNLQPDE